MKNKNYKIKAVAIIGLLLLTTLGAITNQAERENLVIKIDEWGLKYKYFSKGQAIECKTELTNNFNCPVEVDIEFKVNLNEVVTLTKTVTLDTYEENKEISVGYVLWDNDFNNKKLEFKIIYIDPYTEQEDTITETPKYVHASEGELKVITIVPNANEEPRRNHECTILVEVKNDCRLSFSQDFYTSLRVQQTGFHFPDESKGGLNAFASTLVDFTFTWPREYEELYFYADADSQCDVVELAEQYEVFGHITARANCAPHRTEESISKGNRHISLHFTGNDYEQDHMKCRVWWDDGYNNEYGFYVPNIDGTYIFYQPEHQYAKWGRYTIEYEIEDDIGGISNRYYTDEQILANSISLPNSSEVDEDSVPFNPDPEPTQEIVNVTGFFIDYTGDGIWDEYQPTEIDIQVLTTGVYYPLTYDPQTDQYSVDLNLDGEADIEEEACDIIVDIEQ